MLKTTYNIITRVTYYDRINPLDEGLGHLSLSLSQCMQPESRFTDPCMQV